MGRKRIKKEKKRELIRGTGRGIKSQRTRQEQGEMQRRVGLRVRYY